MTTSGDDCCQRHPQYDAANRVRTKELPDETTLTMTYDAIGNLTSFTDQGGATTYSYNAVNLVTSLTDPNGPPPPLATTTTTVAPAWPIPMGSP